MLTFRFSCHFEELATRNPQGDNLQETVLEISRYNALWVLPQSVSLEMTYSRVDFDKWQQNLGRGYESWNLP